MNDDTDITPTFPAQRTDQQGAVYWVDSEGQAFSPQLHMGPCDDKLGVDDDGRWVLRPKPRRGRPRKPKAQTAPLPLVPAAPLPPTTVPARVWFVWRASTDPLTPGEPVGLGAFTDAEQALAVLADHPGARVLEASVS